MRIACSLGAVLIPLMGAGVGGLFGDVSTDEVAEHVRSVVHDLLP